MGEASKIPLQQVLDATDQEAITYDFKPGNENN